MGIFLLLLSALALYCAAVFDPRNCGRDASLAACLTSPAWGHELLPALLDFLSRLALLFPATMLIAAQVSHAPWSRRWKIEQIFRRNAADLAAVDGGPLERLVATLRKLCAKGNLTPDQIEAFALEALALANAPEQKDREAFDRIRDGKAKEAAEEIEKRFTRDKEGREIATDEDRMRQLARLYVPFDTVKAGDVGDEAGGAAAD